MELRPNHKRIMFHQPSNTYHAYKSYANLFNQFSFIFHVESIPTHHSQSMKPTIHVACPNRVKLIHRRL